VRGGCRVLVSLLSSSLSYPFHSYLVLRPVCTPTSHTLEIVLQLLLNFLLNLDYKPFVVPSFWVVSNTSLSPQPTPSSPSHHAHLSNSRSSGECHLPTACSCPAALAAVQGGHQHHLLTDTRRPGSRSGTLVVTPPSRVSCAWYSLWPGQCC
jgi:hypothetical protein